MTAEHWRVDAGDADVALLDIPPALARDRAFHIELQFVVRTPEAPADAWLALTVELDGARAWQRRVPAVCAGQTDTLDFHCRRVVPEGRPLRVRALTQVGGGARRHALRLEATEQRDDA